jgi:2,4-dienoyl-CoA reductase-like NADH-dependent reductase (Old Yellow Enzyme family)
VPAVVTNAEIEEATARFAFVARVAERAGFNGVQVHAAHGYLASQLLSPRVNRRGGSIEDAHRTHGAAAHPLLRQTRADIAAHKFSPQMRVAPNAQRRAFSTGSR